MTTAEPNEMTRRRAPNDVEPLWHVRLPSGMVTMTLDDLDAAFQQGSISEQTLVAREDEGLLRPLGVVAGLFEEQDNDALRLEQPWSRAPDISGVRPAACARRPDHEPALASVPPWTLLDRQGYAEPSLAREAIAPWESAPMRWLCQARAALRPMLGRATGWLAARSPRLRYALGVALVASLIAVCALWATQSRAPAAVLATHLAAEPRPSLTRAAPVTTPQNSPLPLAASPAAKAGIPSHAVVSGAEFDLPIVKEAARRGRAFAEGRQAGRAQGGRRSSRKAKASRARANRE